MQVIQPDTLNGGLSLFLETSQLLSKLTEEELTLLRAHEVRFMIPIEFQDAVNSKYVNGRILSHKRDKLNNILCRYRSDLVVDRAELDGTPFGDVLDKFERLIDLDQSQLVKYLRLEENDVLLLDNARWMHGRTEIRDEGRHLVRIRFQTKYKELFPEF